MKPLMLITGPVTTRSGYGSHTRDLVRSLMSMDKFDIHINSLRWGNTPMNALDANNPVDKTVPKKWWRDWGYTFMRRYIYSVMKEVAGDSFAGNVAVEAADVGAMVLKNSVTTPSEYKKTSYRYKKMRGDLK